MTGDALPEDPEDLLPDDSIMALSEYLSMMRALGMRDRFSAVYHLLRADDGMPRDELRARTQLSDAALGNALDSLRDVGLVKRSDYQDETYYRATGMARTLLRGGLFAVLREERDFPRAE